MKRIEPPNGSKETLLELTTAKFVYPPLRAALADRQHINRPISAVPAGKIADSTSAHSSPEQLSRHSETAITGSRPPCRQHGAAYRIQMPEGIPYTTDSNIPVSALDLPCAARRRTIASFHGVQRSITPIRLRPAANSAAGRHYYTTPVRQGNRTACRHSDSTRS